MQKVVTNARIHTLTYFRAIYALFNNLLEVATFQGLHRI